MVAINTNVVVALPQVYEKIMNLNREDYACPSSSTFVMKNENDDRFNLFSNRMEFPMTDYARTQLNNRWSGFNTFSKTLDENKYDDIYTKTLSDLLARDERKIVVRTMNPDGERVARAVVSDRFKPIDDSLIVPDVCEIIGDHNDKWRSLGGQVTDTNTFIRFITRDPQISMNIGGRRREMHVGFQYKNSEVGCGYTQFSAFFFDSFCENGCVFGTSTIADVKFMHRGSKISTDFGRILEERIQKQELLNIKGAIVDATRLAVEGTYIPEVRQLLEDSINCKIPDNTNVSDFIKLIGKEVGLTNREQEDALVHYDGTNSKYGVQAAITALAQDSKSFMRREELERAGGKVINMKDRAWRAIAELSA